MRAAEPRPDCALCPRLASLRRANAEKYPDYHNAPVANLGSDAAVILIVGLAPGLRGANATGIPFVGDDAGRLLFEAMRGAGLAADPPGGPTTLGDPRAPGGHAPKGVMITNAVRCLPPDNRPSAAEVNTCRQYLAATLQSLPALKVILTLGKIAHDSTVRALGLKPAHAPFGHDRLYPLPPRGPTLISSYHCSRYNVNTGRLTAAMFAQVMARVRAAASADPA